MAKEKGNEAADCTVALRGIPLGRAEISRDGGWLYLSLALDIGGETGCGHCGENSQPLWDAFSYPE